MKTTVQNLYQNAGELAGSRVTVSGWVRTVRESKALGFIELHDGTYMKSLQVVFERAKLEEGSELKLATGLRAERGGHAGAHPRIEAAL